MSRNRYADLHTGTVFDLFCHFIGNRWVKFSVFFHFLFQFFFTKLCIFFGNRTFCYRQNRKSASVSLSSLDGSHYFINIIWNLRNQDNVCAAGDSCVQGQPAYFMSHNFHDKYTIVGGCGCMDAVDGFCCNIHCAVETEGHVCTPDIIIDGFRQMNNVQTFFS